MNTTIRGRNIGVTLVMALLAVLLLVAVLFAVQPTTTTSDRGGHPANYVRSADGTGGSSMPQNPDVKRHAEVVERLGNGSLR